MYINGFLHMHTHSEILENQQSGELLLLTSRIDSTDVRDVFSINTNAITITTLYT